MNDSSSSVETLCAAGTDPSKHFAALRQAALAFNAAYTEQLVEGLSLCPFAREARRKGETRRAVIWPGPGYRRPLLECLQAALGDPHISVLQVIFPQLCCSPDAWIEFCHQVTASAQAGRGRASFVVAALHPHLPYRTDNPYALVPLFRRAPDPTIQWIRASALKKVAEGREKGSTFVDSADLSALLSGVEPPPSLYERVAELNQQTAQKLGVVALERRFLQLHQEARKKYDQLGAR